MYDICIIGGGINGCGIARDAAGRGYKVLLLEKGDFGCETSSKSTKLIHGGLRYLEHFEFNLVRKSLKERDVLLNLAPHVIWPMRFVLPHVPSLRPLWFIRLGLYLYDYLSGKTILKKSEITNVNIDILNKKINKGVAYSDCWVEDSRLVILNAMDAEMRGATLKRDEACAAITKQESCWEIQTRQDSYQAQMIVNAAGPWASHLIDGVEQLDKRPLRLVKGSHIIVPKLYTGDEAYILQNEDKRIVFAIPYEGDYSLIGTTDVDVGDDPDQENNTNSTEINYLCSVVNKFFNKNIGSIDVVDTYSGVRPLVDDGEGNVSKVSRDYTLDLQRCGALPFLSVLGGKLTTYRVLAEEVVDIIDDAFQKTPAHWTAYEKLPGGDIRDNDFERFVSEQATNYPFLSRALIRRYARAYGSCMNIILDGVKSLDDMGQDLGGGVYGRELDYLRAYEFARTDEDVLWRRSKLGLHLDKATQRAIKLYMEEKNE